MEEYLENLQSLRSQMNDIEVVAAKRVVEEQRQNTAIEGLEKDILLATSETTRLNAKCEELEKEKAQICCQISDKHKRILSLENETSTLSQSLEFLRQQTVSAAAGLEERRSHFAKIKEDLVLKLQQRYEWLNSYKRKIETTNLVEEHTILQRENISMICEKLSEQVQSKKTEFEKLKARNSQLHDENVKSELLISQLEQKMETFTGTLKALDMEALEEEHKALLSDEAGELEYLKSLTDQVQQIKAVSHAVKCQCGEEYMVKMMD